MQIKFLGTTGTVTGSMYLRASGAVKILVDCGLSQGYQRRIPLAESVELP